VVGWLCSWSTHWLGLYLLVTELALMNVAGSLGTYLYRDLGRGERWALLQQCTLALAQEQEGCAVSWWFLFLTSMVLVFGGTESVTHFWFPTRRAAKPLVLEVLKAGENFMFSGYSRPNRCSVLVTCECCLILQQRVASPTRPKSPSSTVKKIYLSEEWKWHEESGFASIHLCGVNICIITVKGHADAYVN